MNRKDFKEEMMTSSNAAVKRANKYLEPLDRTLSINWEYDWVDDSLSDAIGVYEHDSIDSGEISIGFNVDNLYKSFINQVENHPWSDPYTILDEIIQTNVYHEMGHGLVELINEYLEETDDLDDLYDANQELFDNVLDNEEDSVEEFAWAFYDNELENSGLDKIIKLYLNMYNNQNTINEAKNMSSGRTLMKATTEWMAEKYDEMNKELFGGRLGKCYFQIFTTGRGSQGHTLGWFKMQGRGLRVNRRSRRMFKDSFGNITYIDSQNFYDLCWPTIELNGHYSGTEDALLGTLVHEMCHYYTYMYGYCPRQGHGREFREIGELVSSRSNGKFTIQRLASAEEMENYELDDDMKAKREKRLANTKARISAVIIFKDNGEVRLTMTSSDRLINLMVNSVEERQGEEIVVNNDPKVIDFLYGKNFKRNMRTWRYWEIGSRPWINELKGLLNGQEPQQENKPQQEVEPKERRRIFSIKTNNGVFECDGNNYSTLFKTLRERFPKMSDETIGKIINNPSNYKVMENRKNTRNIIREVIEEFIETENGGDNINISPNMNLGLKSPLETLGV